MRLVSNFLRSSIGAKFIMAITGLILTGFVIGHMLGNWQLFGGEKLLNDYALFLHSKPLLLWTARSFLFLTFTIHITMGTRLYFLNRKARPIDYQEKRWRKASFPSRYMFITGLFILTFVVYHVLHFTLGKIDPLNTHFVTPEGHADVYRIVVTAFQNPWIATSYIVSMIFLGLHLGHGVSSALQTLGLNHPKYNRLCNLLGPLSAVFLAGGNVLLPLAVWLGIIK